MEIDFSFCGKYENEVEKLELIECGNTPLFGYNYWLWKPLFKINNYGAFKTYEIVWLNAWFEFRPFGKWEKSEPK